MEAKIEKEIASKLEKENNKDNEKETEEYSKEEINKIYTSEEISNENNEDIFYKIDNLNISEIKNLEKAKIKKIKLYNELIGEYEFKSPLINSILPKQSYISSLFKENEILNLITYNNKLDIHDLENFYPIFYKYLNSYRDIQLSLSDLEIRTNLMKIYIFHILNHVMKRKEEIELNNIIEKIINEDENNEYKQLDKELFINHDNDFIKNYYSQFKKLEKNNGKQFQIYYKKIKEIYTTKDLETTNIKDQGFTYPKILILLPYKKHARLIIEEIINVFNKGNWNGISGKKKLKNEYGEFDSLNDCFKLGINFSFFDNKINLFTPFEESDIIIASPLGLKLTSPNEKDKTVKNKKVYDFLSSIEILLMDFSEVFIYQNLDHLDEILSFINKIPKNNQNIVNINRIKDNYSNGFGNLVRQSIIISHFKSIDLDVLINEYCNNINGRIIINENCINQIEKIKKDFSEKYPNASINDIEVRFEFKILNNLKGEDDYDDKFNYFTKNIWKNLYESFDRHTIIFVSSTFDFLRLKSFFKQKSKSVVFISEDTDKKDWQRNRLFFEQGKYKFLLYDERAHVYKKINLKFAKNIFFYSLPEDPKIFYEMIDLIDPVKYRKDLEKYNIKNEDKNSQIFGSVISLVTPIERYNIEKILGKIGKKIMKEKMEYYSC